MMGSTIFAQQFFKPYLKMWFEFQIENSIKNSLKTDTILYYMLFQKNLKITTI